MTNKVVWFDIPVADLDRAEAFYRAVMGFELQLEFEDTAVSVIVHQTDEVAGCLFQDAQVQPSAQGTLLYFNLSGRLDQAIAEVEPRGGKILQEKHSIGPFGQRAVVLDSEGNRIALFSE